MPGDPKECRAHATRCEELAKTVENPEHARVLTHLARQWLRLALQLERAQATPNERKRITQEAVNVLCRRWRRIPRVLALPVLPVPFVVYSGAFSF